MGTVSGAVTSAGWQITLCDPIDKWRPVVPKNYTLLYLLNGWSLSSLAFRTYKLSHTSNLYSQKVKANVRRSTYDMSDKYITV